MNGGDDAGAANAGEGEDGADDDPADPLAAAGVDPVVPESAADAAGEDFPDDDEVRAFLREVAGDVRGDSSESKQLSAILYRVSDLYDPDEQTSPEEIYLNVRHIMQIKAQGGIER
jgi:hypothetical protein